MTKRIHRTRVAATGLLVLQISVSAFTQGGKKLENLGTVQSSSSRSTGAGAESSRVAVAKAGQADDVGNLQLEGKRRPLYRLTPSDVVAVAFSLSPEYDQILTIHPDGYVALKDGGAVFAQGLTVEEFRAAVVRAYAGYLHNPQVTVDLKEFEHPYFVAGGEVGRPGKYELRADTTIVEAVEMAGGLTHQAKHSQVLLFRRVNDDLVESHIFNLKKMLKERNLGEAAQLRPGDLVFVPQNSISKIERFLTKPSLSMYVSPAQF